MRRAAGLGGWRRGTAKVDCARAPSQGFSLVELIVVIAIIGLAAAVVVVSVPEPGGGINSEAERFAARAKAARDSAIVGSRPVLVEMDAGGYGILRRIGGEWRPASRHQWSEGTEAEMSGGSDGRIRFEATGLAEPALVVLRRDRREAVVQIGQDGAVHVRR